MNDRFVNRLLKISSSRCCKFSFGVSKCLKDDADQAPDKGRLLYFLWLTATPINQFTPFIVSIGIGGDNVDSYFYIQLMVRTLPIPSLRKFSMFDQESFCN